MSGSRWVIIPLWLSESWRSFWYSSSVYSCHLFLLSFASVRSILFVFYWAHLCMKCSLGRLHLICVLIKWREITRFCFSQLRLTSKSMSATTVLYCLTLNCRVLFPWEKLFPWVLIHKLIALWVGSQQTSWALHSVHYIFRVLWI